MVTWCGPGNIYQTFHDFGLVLWLFFLPCGDVECCIDPPFCQAVLASFHCLCFSGTVYQMAWWFFAEHKELALGNFLLYPKIHCVSLKIRYSLPTRWVFSIFNVFPFFVGSLFGWCFIPRGIQYIPSLSWVLLRLVHIFLGCLWLLLSLIFLLMRMHVI